VRGNLCQGLYVENTYIQIYIYITIIIHETEVCRALEYRHQRNQIGNTKRSQTAAIRRSPREGSAAARQAPSQTAAPVSDGEVSINIYGQTNRVVQQQNERERERERERVCVCVCVRVRVR
jgi:hypothetical protein